MIGLLPYRTMCYCWKTSQVFSDNQPSATQYLPRFLGCLLFGIPRPSPYSMPPRCCTLTYTNTQKKRNFVNTSSIDNDMMDDIGMKLYEVSVQLPTFSEIACVIQLYIYYACLWLVLLAPTSTWGYLEQHLPCLDVHPNYFAEFTTHDNQFMYIIYIYMDICGSRMVCLYKM